MPIQTERLARGIYCHHWKGHVTADEVVRAFEMEKKLGDADYCNKYIVILDGEETRTIPFNLAKLSGAFSGDELITLVYKSPSIGQKLGEIIGAMVKLPFEFYDDWDKTLARAHELIELNEAIVFRSKSA